MPNAIALNCGAYRLYKDNLEKQEDLPLLYCFLDNVNDETRQLVSPYYFITEKFPPTFIMSCNGDILIEDYSYMKEMLEKKGVKTVGNFYGTEKEPLFHVFHCDIRNATAKVCNKEEIDFFRKNMKS